MAYIAIILSIIILLIESRKCKKNGAITCTLIAAIFNFIFLHFWLILRVVGVEQDITDERVITNILISDLAWVFMSNLMKGRNISTNSFVVSSSNKYPVTIFFIITVLVILIYMSKVGVSILADDIEWARHTSKKGYGYFNIFITRGGLLAATLSYILYKARIFKTTLAGAIIFSIIVLQLATGFRSYVITTCLSLWLCRLIIHQNYDASKMVIAGLLGAGVFIFITAYKSGIGISGMTLSDFGDEIWPYMDHRVVMEVPRIIGRILYLTDMHGYALGKTYWWDIQAAMPGPGYSFGDRLFMWLATKQEIAGIAPIPPGLIGESIMNFGEWSVPFGMCVAYWIMRKVDDINTQSIISLATKAILCVLLSEIIYLGFGVVLVSRFLPLMAFVAMYFFIEKILSVKVDTVTAQ